jgi:hypothetical protein
VLALALEDQDNFQVVVVFVHDARHNHGIPPDRNTLIKFGRVAGEKVMAWSLSRNKMA